MNKKEEVRVVIDGLPSDMIDAVLMQEHCVTLIGDDGESIKVSIAFDCYKVCSFRKNGYSSYFKLSYVRQTIGAHFEHGMLLPLYWGAPGTIYERFLGADAFTSQEIVDAFNNLESPKTDLPQVTQYKMRFILAE